MVFKKALMAGLIALAVLAADLRAEIVCAGVLGNSGEQGETLVRFSGGRLARGGMGVAMDRYGSLWERAGNGNLNRYAVDGRLLGQYEIPEVRDGRGDRLTIAGDVLGLLVGGRVYSLDVTAEPGSSAKPLGISAAHMSFGSRNGRVAILDGERNLLLLDLRKGIREKVADLPWEGLSDLEMTPDGTIYVDTRAGMRRVENGGPVEGWSGRRPGGNPQFLDGHWYGHAWHGTIRRFGPDMRPAPGVVFGGASGSFIGWLPESVDLVQGRGMSIVRDGLFAVSGTPSIILLLKWDPEQGKMQQIRRIGSLPHCSSVAIDSEGHVWAGGGTWEWTDRPGAPRAQGHPTVQSPSQAVVLEGGYMVAYGKRYGSRPSLVSGKLVEGEYGRVQPHGLPDKDFFQSDYRAATVYRGQGGRTLLLMTADGRARALRISDKGRFGGDLGAVGLRTTGPVKAWTSLAMKGEDTLLAGADGHVIEFSREGANWKESARWRSWGAKPVDSLGQTIHLATSGGRLWVADTTRHRVLCFRASGQEPAGTFGRADHAGGDLDALRSPRVIAASGNRAVVYDAGNQRLVKLRVK